MRLTRQPENLLIIAFLLILIISFGFWGESVLINILGLKIFIDGKTIIYLLAILMITFWIIYRTLTRYLVNKSLKWIHIIITIGLIAYFLATETWYSKNNAKSEMETYLFSQLMINKERMISVTSVTGIIFILGQLTLIFNLSLGLLNRNKKKGT